MPSSRPPPRPRQTPLAVVGIIDDPCPYFPDRLSRIPFRLPLGPLDDDQFDVLLAGGDRRSGEFLYRPDCPSCVACEALRIPVERFVPTRSQRDVLRRNRDVHIEAGPLVFDEEHARLYDRHKRERGLEDPSTPHTTVDDYRQSFGTRFVPALELRYRVEGRLAAVSVCDVGSEGFSSVYHYFDPDLSKRSLGVYSVLREVELCRERGLRWYYLGLWADGSRPLAYKTGYHPHQRLRQGVWWEHASPTAEPIAVEDAPPLPPELRRDDRTG